MVNEISTRIKISCRKFVEDFLLDIWEDNENEAYNSAINVFEILYTQPNFAKMKDFDVENAIVCDEFGNEIVIEDYIENRNVYFQLILDFENGFPKIIEYDDSIFYIPEINIFSKIKFDFKIVENYENSIFLQKMDNGEFVEIIRATDNNLEIAKGRIVDDKTALTILLQNDCETMLNMKEFSKLKTLLEKSSLTK